MPGSFFAVLGDLLELLHFLVQPAFFLFLTAGEIKVHGLMKIIDVHGTASSDSITTCADLKE